MELESKAYYEEQKGKITIWMHPKEEEKILKLLKIKGIKIQIK
jgi:hypothetical protein